MLDFDKYLMRYGEFGVQAIVERIERNEDIRLRSIMPLEDRWNALMQNAAVYQQPSMA